MAASGAKASQAGLAHGRPHRVSRAVGSWARFMAEEPVKPKTRSRKPQPTTLTMLERAFSWEPEREAETVGAGC